MSDRRGEHPVIVRHLLRAGLGRAARLVRARQHDIRHREVLLRRQQHPNLECGRSHLARSKLKITHQRNEDRMPQGKIKMFNEEKRFGFIMPEMATTTFSFTRARYARATTSP